MYKNILITGGIGYIGSHTAIEMLSAGYKVLLLDNLCNSSMNTLKKMSLITNKDIPFMKGDIRDDKLLTQIFSENNLITKRPNTGEIPAKNFYKIIGKKAKKDIRTGYFRDSI